MNKDRIDELLKQSDESTEAGDLDLALALCREAVALLPEPFNDQPQATEVITAIGDLYYMKGELAKAEQAFSDVLLCPGAAGSQYIRLRRGQIAFDLGDTKKAKVELACAFMNGGKEIFDGEDPKYYDFIVPVMKTALAD